MTQKDRKREGEREREKNCFRLVKGKKNKKKNTLCYSDHTLSPEAKKNPTITGCMWR